MKSRILLVDDDLAFNGLLGAALEEEGYEVVQVYNLAQAKKQISEEIFDCLILDVRLPDGSGLEILPEASANTPVIVVSAHGDINTAIEAVRNGAFNFLEKPFDLTHALLEVKRAIEFSEVSRERDNLAEMVVAEPPVEILGNSKSVIRMKETIEMIAPKKVTVLLEGESGTGKEVVARTIHQKSGRKKFVPINCGAIPENLFESELFGYEKGAFTGAMNSKPGLIEESHRGTLFLDEISEMPLPMQVKLLRVIQEREIERIGATKSQKVDVRIIAATNRNLEEMIKQKTFREDLYYRLNVINIQIPSLRERKEDIPLLAKHLMRTISSEMERHVTDISEDAMAALSAYDWPGNIRELGNLIERALNLVDKQAAIGIEQLPRYITQSISRNDNQSGGRIVPIRMEGSLKEITQEIEKKAIKDALEEFRGNKLRAALKLDISRTSLYEKMKVYGL